MSGFDEVKDKAQDFMGQAKDKLGQQNQDDENRDDRQGEGMSGQLRDKASDAMNSAKDRFGGN